MSRVALVNPSLVLEPDPYGQTVDPKMPMGLLYLASALENQGHTVELIDAAFGGLQASGILDMLCAFRPDVVGISSVSAVQRRSVELATLVKKFLKPAPLVVLGGVHATLQPESFLRHRSVDFVTVGEGDVALPKLCSDPNTPSEIHGVCFKTGTDTFTIPDGAPRVRDLDALPFPAYHLLDLKSYFKRNKKLCLLASRGCVHACTYCCSPQVWGREIVFRTPDSIAREIDYYRSVYPAVQKFHFLDDNLPLWGDGLFELCNLLEPMNIKWRCIGSIDQISEPMARRMLMSGCYAISFGIETGSQDIQRMCGKNLDLDTIAERVRAISSLGIRTKAFFMFGFPSETRDQMAETMRLAVALKQHGLSDVAFLPLVPYPGTAIHADHCCKGIPGFGESDQVVDWLDPGNPGASALAKYRTYPLVSANEFFTGVQLRAIATYAYRVFWEETVPIEARRSMQTYTAELQRVG